MFNPTKKLVDLLDEVIDLPSQLPDWCKFLNHHPSQGYDTLNNKYEELYRKTNPIVNGENLELINLHRQIISAYTQGRLFYGKQIYHKDRLITELDNKLGGICGRKKELLHLSTASTY